MSWRRHGKKQPMDPWSDLSPTQRHQIRNAHGDRAERADMRRVDDPEHPRTPHPDPAVQALIEGGWLEVSDRPITVGDLEHAVLLVRLAAPVAFLVAERRQGVWMLGDDWNHRCDTFSEAHQIAERWRSHDGRVDSGDIAVLAVTVVPEENTDAQ